MAAKPSRVSLASDLAMSERLREGRQEPGVVRIPPFQRRWLGLICQHRVPDLEAAWIFIRVLNPRRTCPLNHIAARARQRRAFETPLLSSPFAPWLVGLGWRRLPLARLTWGSPDTGAAVSLAERRPIRQGCTFR